MVKVSVLGAVGRLDDTEALVRYLQNLKPGSGLIVDAEMVCGKDHLLSAAKHAIRAFERGDNASDSLAMETLLYASGERQISKAMKKMGVKIGSSQAALVFFDVPSVDEALREMHLSRDDDVLEASVEKARKFGISQEEIKAVSADMVEDLVLERVAFVGMQK